MKTHDPALNANYWKGRWERDEIGWHQKEPEEDLVQYFSDIAPTRVLVPLCGKSLDLAWLASRGHEVIGVELSEIACAAFFSEQQLVPQITSTAGFKVYSYGRYTLYCGSFFELTPQLLGTVGAVYDRAALIALPLELRIQYTAHMGELIGNSSGALDFHFLQILLERSPHDEEGPPFSVSHSELQEHYSRSFDIKLIHKQAVDLDPNGKTSFQSVYFLNKRLRPSIT